MNLTLRQAKGNFFDRESVMTAIGKARVKVISRQGAYTRTVMKRLMRRKDGPAPPGSPPNAHVGWIRDNVEFVYDHGSESGVVGPVRLGDSNVLETLEKGGFVLVRGIYNRQGEFIPLVFLKPEARSKIVASGRFVTIKVKIEARPLVPATAKAVKPKLAGFWKDQVRK